MKTLRQLSCTILAVALAFLGTACSSLAFWRDPAAPATEFALRRNYGSHMVLQQGRPIPVCGTANPGGIVTVTLGKATVQATADGDGNWRAVLPPMRGGKAPLQLTVAGAEDVAPIVLDDVLIGEVWFCGGQSNMEMPLWTGRHGWTNTNGDKVAAAGMEVPTIRLFNAARNKYVSSYAIQEEPVGTWTLPTPEELRPFSAVAYFFALELTARLDVPVGLIESCWGGTRIEPWISEAAYRNSGDPDFDNIVDLLKTVDPENPAKPYREQQKEWYDSLMAQAEETGAAARRWATAAHQASHANGWETQEKTQGQAIHGRVNGKTGVFWFVTYVDIPASWAGKKALLDFTNMDDCDTTYFNGVQIGSTDLGDARWPSNTRRRYEIPAELMKAGRAKVAIRLTNLWGNGGLPKDRLLVSGDQTIRLDGPWHTRTELLLDTTNLPRYPDDSIVPNSVQFPAALFNSMVSPWTRFPVRGVIWYQGESNAGSPDRYARLFNLLAQDWREHWRQDYLDHRTLQGIPPMAFIYCQLSGHVPGGHWPKFRQMQQDLLKCDPAYGMAVTMDHGDNTSIHPPEKQPVGQRLAAEAMRICYGSKAISSGPVPTACTAQGASVTVTFGNCGLGLVATDGKPLAGFEVAGEDGKFFPATAQIQGDSVVFTAAEVTAPVRVRYAWKGYCGEMNLGNQDGFAAGPFDTATLAPPAAEE